MNEHKIIFLFGGPGAEHEVSRATAERSMTAFKPHFKICPVFIDKESHWHMALKYTEPTDAWSEAEKLNAESGISAEEALAHIQELQPELVFLGLHGTFGEDGTIQALLEARGIAFTGSDAEASGFAMDKPRVFQRLQNEAILVPEFLELTVEMTEKDKLEFVNYIQLPVVVIPADSGSSVGVTIVREMSDLDEAIANARSESERVMITKYIAGREVSAGVLATDKNELISLPPTELIPQKNHEFFDYEAKYTPGHTKEVTPPDMSPSLIQEIQQLASRVHKIIGADGYSRTDMIVTPDNTIFILELNTLPGLTATSILPQQAKAHGISYPDLLETICNAVNTTGKDFVTAVH